MPTYRARHCWPRYERSARIGVRRRGLSRSGSEIEGARFRILPAAQTRSISSRTRSQARTLLPGGETELFTHPTGSEGDKAASAPGLLLGYGTRSRWTWLPPWSTGPSHRIRRGGNGIYPKAGSQPPCGRISDLSRRPSRAERQSEPSDGSGRSRCDIADFDSVSHLAVI